MASLRKGVEAPSIASLKLVAVSSQVSKRVVGFDSSTPELSLTGEDDEDGAVSPSRLSGLEPEPLDHAVVQVMNALRLVSDLHSHCLVPSCSVEAQAQTVSRNK